MVISKSFSQKCKYRGQCQLIQGKGGVRKPGQVGQDCWKRVLKTQNKSACICVLASTVAFQLAYSPEVISHHLFGGSEVMRIMMQKIMLEKITLHITTGLSRRLQGAPARRRYWGSTNSALPGAQRV